MLKFTSQLWSSWICKQFCKIIETWRDCRRMGIICCDENYMTVFLNISSRRWCLYSFATKTKNMCSIILGYCIQYLYCHVRCRHCDCGNACTSHVHLTSKLDGHDKSVQWNDHNEHTKGTVRTFSIGLFFAGGHSFTVQQLATIYGAFSWNLFSSKALPWRENNIHGDTIYP